MNIEQISKEDKIRIYDFILNRDEAYEASWYKENKTGLKNITIVTIENFGWFDDNMPIVGVSRSIGDYLDFNNMILVTVSNNPKVWFGNQDLFSEEELGKIFLFIVTNMDILCKNFRRELDSTHELTKNLESI